MEVDWELCSLVRKETDRSDLSPREDYHLECYLKNPDEEILRKNALKVLSDRLRQRADQSIKDSEVADYLMKIKFDDFSVRLDKAMTRFQDLSTNPYSGVKKPNQLEQYRSLNDDWNSAKALFRRVLSLEKNSDRPAEPAL